MMKRLLLIDGDGLCYHSLRETIEESLVVLEEKIQNMFEKTEGTHYTMFVSKGTYFRHDIAGYKEKRVYSSKNPWVKVLKEVLISKYKAQYMPKVEADDLVAYFHTLPVWLRFEGIGDDTPIEDEFINKEVERIVCSPDKDLLQGLVGNHFNYSYKITPKAKEKSKVEGDYSYKDEDIVKGWWVETNLVQSINFLRGQMIIGDTSDGISGIPKKGEAYWVKMCDRGDLSYAHILIEYISYFGETQGIYEFQKNYRLLRILSTKEDFLREIGKVPNYPTIVEIPKKEEYFKPSKDF